MKPTEALKNEHRVIEQVLDCLEAMARQAESQGKLDGPAARKALDFFRNFADRCHHGKEEQHLFPAMEARGFARDQGPTGVMLHEHELGRRLLGELASAVDGAEAGAPEPIQRFAARAFEYISLLREHIWKEDNRLFVMADRVLSPEEQERLLGSFQHAEDHDMEPGAHEKYLALAHELADRFHVIQVLPGHVDDRCGCHQGAGVG